MPNEFRTKFFPPLLASLAATALVGSVNIFAAKRVIESEIGASNRRISALESSVEKHQDFSSYAVRGYDRTDADHEARLQRLEKALERFEQKLDRVLVIKQTP